MWESRLAHFGASNCQAHSFCRMREVLRIVKPLGVCCNSKLPPALIDVLACAPAMEQAIPVNMLRREVCACLFCYSECLRFQGYPYHIGHPYPSVGLRAFWERE